MIYFGYWLVIILDPTNKLNFHLSILYGNASLEEKNLQFCVFFFLKIEI